MKTATSFLLILGLFGRYDCYCPPLSAPETTKLTCVEPVKQLRVNCSASWLAEGSIAYFRCVKGSGKIAKGRIVCSEDGVHRHVEKLGGRPEDRSSDQLPCGIKKDTQKPDIHVYGYHAPIHYKLTDAVDPDFRHHGVVLHNKFRRMHGSPPLQLQEKLSKLAQEWADQVSRTGKLDMAPDLLYGQNIFLAQTGDKNNLTAAVNDAVQNWYYNGVSEYCWDDLSDNWSDSLTLDFSQLLWRESRYIGIGAAPVNSGNRTAVVAFYDPTGNIVIDGDEEGSCKLFELNVLPLQVNSTL